MLTFLVSSGLIKLLIPALIAAIPGIVAFFFRGHDQAKANFLLGVQVAFFAVNEIAKRTPNDVDDKVALGLKILKDHLEGAGQTMTDADVEAAKKLFSAMHGDGVK